MDGDHDYKDGGLDALLWASFVQGANWQRRRLGVNHRVPTSLHWWFAAKRAYKAWREELVA